MGIVHEITGKVRDRVYVYRKYLTALGEDAKVLDP